MQRPVAQLKLVQSMLKIFVPPRANSVFGESELHTQHMWRLWFYFPREWYSEKVKVDFSLEDMDLSEFKGKATYDQIKAYVLKQTGLKVSSLYIAQIKKKCGMDVGENFNLPKSENARQSQCTPEKEEAIMQAFKHFGIV